MEEEAEGNVGPISYSQAYPRLSLLLPIFLKIEAGFILGRFLSLVTTMVTKVDHGNHRSNDRGNHCSNHRGYFDGYYDGNTFFLQEYIFLDDFLRFSIIFDSFQTQWSSDMAKLGNK